MDKQILQEVQLVKLGAKFYARNRKNSHDLVNQAFWAADLRLTEAKQALNNLREVLLLDEVKHVAVLGHQVWVTGQDAATNHTIFVRII